MDIEDKVLTVNPKGKEEAIWILHQAASRMLRKEILSHFKKVFTKELEDLEFDEVVEVIEDIARNVEDKYFREIYGDINCFDFEIN